MAEEAGYEELLRLIRITRKERAHLSQRAAAEVAGLSTVWWRNVEGGRVRANVDTLSRMMFALDISPELLYDMGYPEVAQGVEERKRFLERGSDDGTETLDPAEAHILRTPDITARQRYSLLAHLRTLREVDLADPITREWEMSLLDKGRRRRNR